MSSRSFQIPGDFSRCSLIKYTCQASFTTTGETSGATPVSAGCETSRDVKLGGTLKPLQAVIFQRVRCVTPATVIHAKLQQHDDGSNH